jgi:hypothetical protein
VLQERLVETGRWAEMEEWLRVYRHTGYAAIDVAGFLLHYFASGGRGSLKEFGVRVAPVRRQLAALGGRREFPSPSSVSRLLGGAEECEVRPTGPRLLLEAAGAKDMLQHLAAAVRDTFGDPWHVFDVDATVQAFRERALPQGADLPTPRRRCGPELARRGYAGRKRGELRCSRGTLQHAGTGLWVGLVLSPERADGAACLPPLLDALDLACHVGGLARERVMLRADGGGGNVPWLTVCQRRGVRYLTRWGHYSLFGRADVQQRLARGPWHRVPSSGSGPQREALELGEVELHASPQTRDADGAHFEPVRSRMVVSRFRADKTASVGVQLDGWVYELFATDLPAGAWPAPETVAQYFGRAAEENRFAQEDRELGLDHLFSYHLPGQELACLLGLMVWNLRQTEGFAHHTPSVELPPPVARQAIQVISATPLEEAQNEAEPTPSEETPVATAPDAPKEDPGAARAAFDELAWTRILARLGPGWARTKDGEGLTCPRGNALSPSAVIPSRHAAGLPSLRLLASARPCQTCPRPRICASTDTSYFVKSVAVPLTTEQGRVMSELLSATRRRSAADGRPSAGKSSTSTSRHQPPVLLPRADNGPVGPYAPSEVRLIPSEFRRAFQREVRQLAVSVMVPERPRTPRVRPLGLALTAAEVQRRRRSWQARLLDNQLPADILVQVRVSAPRAALLALGLVSAATAPPHANSWIAQANI